MPSTPKEVVMAIPAREIDPAMCVIELLTGAIIGPCDGYKVIRRLGVGGYASVWLAEETVSNRTVAIKVAHGTQAAEEALATEQEFMDQLSARSSIPLFVSALSSFTHICTLTKKVHHCLVLEAMDMDGRAFAKSKPPRKAIKAVMVQLLRALEIMHSHGMVHGDVHPGNLLISSLEEMSNTKEEDMNTSSGNKTTSADKDAKLVVKLSDFGSSLWTSEGRTGTSTAWAFLAPEAVSKPKVALGPTIDIWAFGMTAYYLFRGRQMWQPFCWGTQRDSILQFMVQTFTIVPDHLLDGWTMRSQYFADDGILAKYRAEYWKLFRKQFADDVEALSFLERVLVLDYRYRPTATELLQDPFFANAL